MAEFVQVDDRVQVEVAENDWRDGVVVATRRHAAGAASPSAEETGEPDYIVCADVRVGDEVFEIHADESHAADRNWRPAG